MRRKLQVFISSTYEDMLEERKCAVEAILQSGHIPAGMELFTSGDDSKMEIIKQWIDDSDVFLLILGGKYGSIDKNTSKSYIQLEYEYALEKKKPLFTLVLDEKDGLKKKKEKIGDLAVESEHIAKFTNFRKKVVEEMITSFYKEPNEIKTHIVIKLSEIVKNPDNLGGWVSVKELNDIDDLFVKYTLLSGEIDKLKSKNALHEIWYSKLIEGKTIYDEKVNMYSYNDSPLVWGNIEGVYEGNPNEYIFTGESTSKGLYCIFMSRDKRDYEMGMFNLGNAKVEGKPIYFGKTIFMSKKRGEEFLKSPYLWTKEDVGIDYLHKLKSQHKKEFLKAIKVIDKSKK